VRQPISATALASAEKRQKLQLVMEFWVSAALCNRNFILLKRTKTLEAII
jgi:hypothetical protein